jgi:hypothetical protein
MQPFFSRVRLAGLTGALVLVAMPAVAHFQLLEPTSWLQEDERGDPQKMGPCGGTSADPGKPTGKVTSVQGGDKLHLKIHETIYHPGFYRVALAVNSRDELPKDPVPVTEPSSAGPRSVSGAIVYPPMPPVIADGLFQHITHFDKEQETDVELPNINCSKCTLQVIEFMAAHALNKDGDYTYHHCAVLQIRANPYKPLDTRFPAEKK